jgi:hypothetical protein
MAFGSIVSTSTYITRLNTIRYISLSFFFAATAETGISLKSYEENFQFKAIPILIYFWFRKRFFLESKVQNPRPPKEVVQRIL